MNSASSEMVLFSPSVCFDPYILLLCRVWIAWVSKSFPPKQLPKLNIWLPEPKEIMSTDRADDIYKRLTCFFCLGRSLCHLADLGNHCRRRRTSLFIDMFVYECFVWIGKMHNEQWLFHPSLIAIFFLFRDVLFFITPSTNRYRLPSFKRTCCVIVGFVA